jgi:hypothetical protein
MSIESITTNGRTVEFTPADTAKGTRARKLCAALLVEAENKGALFSVEKYLGELATKLGGTFTPAP